MCLSVIIFIYATCHAIFFIVDILMLPFHTNECNILHHGYASNAWPLIRQIDGFSLFTFCRHVEVEFT